MQVLIGTSGFSYPAWRGGFYPEKLPESKMLGHYAGHFRAVEINNSFYRMPTADVLARSAVERLAEASRGLGDKLGPVLFQLPPNMKKDLVRLDDFLASLPAGLASTVEFRHESWFADDVYDCLRRRRAALCIAESEDVATPLEATTDWGYLRLRREDYDDAMVAAWGARIKTQGWSTAYVFFKHEDTGKGPIAAARLHELMA